MPLFSLVYKFKVFLVFFAVLFLLYMHSPESDALSLLHILEGPSSLHFLGTDDLGRDVFSRLIEGSLLSLSVGISVCLIAGITGTFIGIVSAWFGGWWDVFLMRLTDIFLSFPGVLIAIGIAALSGPSVFNIIFALGFLGWVSFARIARAQTLSVKESEYIQAAQVSGVSSVAILTRYILPNVTAPLIVEAIFTLSGSMLAEAGLSFLGIGVQAPQASLGTMLREGARYLFVAPHMVFFSGFALMLLVLFFNVLGDNVRKKMKIKK